MGSSKVYFSDFRVNAGTNLPEKLQKLIKRPVYENLILT